MQIPSKTAHRPTNKEQGTTVVEFAIVSGLFFLLVFTVLDFAAFGFVNLTMQHAVREGARYAITGQTNLDSSGEPIRERAVIAKIRQSSMGLFDSVMAEGDIYVTDTNGQPVSGFGAPGEIIVIRMDCAWPVVNPFLGSIMPNGNYEFSVAAAMRNEFFPAPPTP